MLPTTLLTYRRKFNRRIVVPDFRVILGLIIIICICSPICLRNNCKLRATHFVSLTDNCKLHHIISTKLQLPRKTSYLLILFFKRCRFFNQRCIANTKFRYNWGMRRDFSEELCLQPYECDVL